MRHSCHSFIFYNSLAFVIISLCNQQKQCKNQKKKKLMKQRVFTINGGWWNHLSLSFKKWLFSFSSFPHSLDSVPKWETIHTWQIAYSITWEFWILFRINKSGYWFQVTSVACGINQFAVINSHGSLFAWGKNPGGCLGQRHLKDQYFPLRVGATYLCSCLVSRWRTSCLCIVFKDFFLTVCLSVSKLH